MWEYVPRLTEILYAEDVDDLLTKLLTGMVVTIEPGIYFTDSCGVRWEDLYEITETGARQLTLSNKSPQA